MLKKASIKRQFKKEITPFDGKPLKGKHFSKKEIDERMKYFGAFFNVPSTNGAH